MSTITINGISIDPSAPKPALMALELDNASAHASDYVIVQTKSPLNKTQRASLAKAGADIIESVPGDAYICYFPKTSLVKLRALPFVAWADIYPKVVKVASSLRNLNPQPGGVEAMRAHLMGVAGALDDAQKTVDVVLHRNVNARKAAKRIAEAAHLTPAEVTVAGGKARLVTKARRLADLAALDEVRHIEEVLPNKLSNSIARKVLRVPTGSAVPGGEGAGEVVAVADTGFDRGSTTNVHPAFTGRVKKLYAVGRPSQKDDPHGHGTHVAGSVLGDGVSATEGSVRGTAPKAKLVLQSILNATNGLSLPPNLNDLFKRPYQTDKARIHTNSWGTPGSFGVYDRQAHEVDQFTFEHRDMLICFSAGNEGKDLNADGRIDPNSVTPPGTAKNCLTVGASENNRPNKLLTYNNGFGEAFPAAPIKDDKTADNPEGIVAFSSRGPIQDGRIKPDVVAPGTFILSTRSRVTQSEGWGLSSDPLYMFNGGTSMATPLVAGCVANVRAFLRTSRGINSPSAALLKALIINGARNIGGQYVPSEAGTIPNNNQGFGRVDLQAVIGPYQAGETVVFFDEKKKLDTGESADQKIAVPAGAKLLKVTLVWTDPPGEGLQSDLDLIVAAGAKKRNGNMPANSTAFDRVNNVEQVVWVNPPSGPATVTVACFRVTQALQDFALVVRVA